MSRALQIIILLLISNIVSMPFLSSAQDADPAKLRSVWSFQRQENEATFWKLDWSPNGEMVAATFFDNTCIILDADDGTVIREINMEVPVTRCDGFSPEGTLPLRTCAFSPDGTLLATGGDDLLVRIFDTGSWELERTFLGHTGSVLCLDWSPDSRYLASGSGTDKVIPQNAGENITRIWDVQEGRQVNVLEGHEDGVLAVRWDGNGTTLATVSDDRTVRTWSFPECDELLSMKGHTSGVLDLDWTPDGTRLITGSRDYKIKVWSVGTGSELMTWSDYNCVRSVDVHPDGDIVATSGVDLTLKIRDVNTGSELKVIKDGVEQNAMVMHSRWSPDGSMLASGLGKSHTVIMYGFSGSGEKDGPEIDVTFIAIIVLSIIGTIGVGFIMFPAFKELRGRRD